MKRRILAWFLLIGFILLIANLLVFHYKMTASFIIYMIIAAFFVLANSIRRK